MNIENKKKFLPLIHNFSSCKTSAIQNLDGEIEKFGNDNKWEVINIEKAHNYSVTSLKSFEEKLYSASNDSIKIWSLNKLKSIFELNINNSPNNLITIWPEK